MTAEKMIEKLLPGSAYAIHPDPAVDALKGALLKDIHRSVYVYRVDCGGCNGCEIEIFASITPLFDVERFGKTPNLPIPHGEKPLHTTEARLPSPTMLPAVLESSECWR